MEHLVSHWETIAKSTLFMHITVVHMQKTSRLCIHIHAFMHYFFLLGKYSRYTYGINTTNRTFSCRTLNSFPYRNE